MKHIDYKKKEKQLKWLVGGLFSGLWAVVTVYSIAVGFQFSDFISRMLLATVLLSSLAGVYHILSSLRFNLALQKYWKRAENEADRPKVIHELKSSLGSYRVRAQYKDAMIRHLLSNFYAQEKAYAESAVQCQAILSLEKSLEELKLLAIHRQFNNLYLQKKGEEALAYFNRYKNYINQAGKFKNIAPLFKLDLVLVTILLKNKAAAQQLLLDFQKSYPSYQKDLIAYYEREIQNEGARSLNTH